MIITVKLDSNIVNVYRFPSICTIYILRAIKIVLHKLQVPVTRTHVYENYRFPKKSKSHSFVVDCEILPAFFLPSSLNVCSSVATRFFSPPKADGNCARGVHARYPYRIPKGSA